MPSTIDIAPNLLHFSPHIILLSPVKVWQRHNHSCVRTMNSLEDDMRGVSLSFVSSTWLIIKDNINNVYNIHKKDKTVTDLVFWGRVSCTLSIKLSYFFCFEAVMKKWKLPIVAKCYNFIVSQDIEKLEKPS